jgi:adenylate cyclase
MGKPTGVLKVLRPSGRQLIRLAISAVPLLLFVPHALGLWPIEFLTRVEHYLYDLRVRLTPVGGVDPRVVIVDIDEVSLAAEGHWPWPRDKLAALTDRLFDDYGIQVLGFDTWFPEADEASAVKLIEELAADPALPAATRAALQARREAFETDRLFSESLVARDVVLGYVFKPRLLEGEPPTKGALPKPIDVDPAAMGEVDWIKPAGYTGNLAVLQEAASAGGFFDTPLVDEDGIVRRAPIFQLYDGKLYESLAFASARLALGSPAVRLAFTGEGPARRLDSIELGESRIPVDANAAALMPFRGPVGSFPYVSATRVLKRTEPRATLAGKIVLLGASAPGLLDIRPTPVGKEYIGVEAHANLVAGILDSRIPFRPAASARIEIITLAVIALITALWLSRLAPQSGLILVIVLILGWGAMNVVAWMRAGMVLPLASPIAYTLITALLQLSYGYFVEIRQRRRLSRIFGQYIPAEIVRELDVNNAELSLEGESREMSVLFSDVRGFTTISEGLAPRELTRLMNDFLTPITEIIHGERGTIDKYMGDAVMAFWGAPLPDTDHARHAVRAALAMVGRMHALKPEFQARGWPEINVGVGVSSGVMNVGNMGSQFRMAYTVLGDTVNLGSRLEGLTKQYGVNVIVSGATAAGAPEIVYRELDLVRVKGKLEPVAVLEPVGTREQLESAVLTAIEEFNMVLAHYRAQRWHDALDILNRLVRDDPRPLYRLYLERIARCRAFPPPANWDGVFVFETK